MTVRVFAVFLCALCALGGELKAASPTLSVISPRGGQRGTEVDVVVAGKNLADAQEVVALYPGITVAKLAVDEKNKDRLAVTLKIAPDCRLGEHAFRVRTATGISDLDTFWVGAFPTVKEKEPNTEFDAAQPIPLDVTVDGSIANEDVDYFEVECKAGQRLSAEVEAMRLGRSFFDPAVAILDAKRFELAASDDSPIIGQDAGCSVKVPADGKYYVLVRESSYGAGANYRLHVGQFPRPTAVVPAGGKPGENVAFKFIGDPLGEFTQTVTLPAAGSKFRLRAETKDGVHPAGIPVRIADLANVVETGTNVDIATATPGPTPAAFHGIVAKADEKDFFKFTAKKGQQLQIDCLAKAVGSPLDPVTEVFNEKGGRLSANDDAGGSQDSTIRFDPPADGDYYVAVRDHLNKGGPDYFYRIEIAPKVSEIRFGVELANGNNPRDQDRQSFAVPKGGRFAQVITIQRENVGGDLKLAFPNLPPGVTATADVLDAGQSQLPVVFEASADAKVGGTLTPVTASPADPKQPAVPARLALDVVMVTANPGRSVYHSHPVDRVATAVTTPAPFSIEVMEPKAPVAQNASMELKVVAKRADGFTGEIKVYPLWKPPGIGIASTATIPADKTETTLSMNAAGNAAARKWKTAVVAEADSGSGNVWVSSQLFTIEVAPALVAFDMQRAAVDQGKPTEVLCKVEIGGKFDGKATVKLIGLPVKATAPDVDLTAGTAEVVFPVTTEAETPVGKHKLFCQVIATVNGETLTQRAGGTELRIDKPLPPKPAPVAAAPEPTKPDAPAPAKPPEPKRLTRLEQLRLEQEAREKAGQK